MKKAYVQFSKQMVVFVSVCVTVLSLLGIVLCAVYEQVEHVAEILRAYIGYATICFVAYSGNSMAEKYLMRKYIPPHENVPE